MIKEAYVSFETAKLLKEKGFEEECMYFYDWDEENEIYRICSNGGSCNETRFSSYYSMPTQQRAMRWLREVHNIHIDTCSIWDAIHWLYQVFVITPRTAHNSYVDKMLYTSYEQAVEAAIKYCLENLI